MSAFLKVIRKFFLNHNKSFRWHLGDYEKHNFFHLKACERRNFDFCVFLEMSSVTGRRVGPGPMPKLAGEGPACVHSNQLLAWG